MEKAVEVMIHEIAGFKTEREERKRKMRAEMAVEMAVERAEIKTRGDQKIREESVVKLVALKAQVEQLKKEKKNLYGVY